jgi:hypothetical protein
MKSQWGDTEKPSRLAEADKLSLFKEETAADGDAPRDLRR